MSNDEIERLIDGVANRLLPVIEKSVAGQISELRTEMNTGSSELRTEMNTGFSELRIEMNSGFSELRSALAETNLKVESIDRTLRAEVSWRDRADRRIRRLETEAGLPDLETEAA